MHADRNTAIALAAILTVWFFGSLIAAKGIFSQETAAWVQAIGAVAAIVAAGWFAGVPIRAAADSAKGQRRRDLEQIRIAMAEAESELQSLRHAVDSDNLISIERSYRRIREHRSIDGALRSWLSLPAREWPNVSLFVCAQRLADAITSLQMQKMLTPPTEVLQFYLSIIDSAVLDLSIELSIAIEE